MPIKIDWNEVAEFRERLERCEIQEGDCQRVLVFLKAFDDLRGVVEAQKISIERYVRTMLGFKTESARKITGKKKESGDSDSAKPKPKGHGRNGVSEYPGAEKVSVAHEKLSAGCLCPECDKGKLYEQNKPGVEIRFKGRPPIEAAVYELEKFRCNLCGRVFTADLPEEAGKEKYDETVGATIGVLKYGSGFPFNRLEELQANAGIPFPASNQWEAAENTAHKIYPVFEELKNQGAHGEVIYNDDTTGRILELMKDNEESERKGIFTTGIVCTEEQKQIALFFTGRNHAGENITEVLRRRHKESGMPIQMCDALSRNESKEFETILSNCLVHGRRNFVDVFESFPKECEYVIESLGEVYKNEEKARKRKMTPEERLRHHQTTSGPVMEELHRWMEEQFKEKKTEPNSGLGSAIKYMLKHWEKLTKFLTVAGAPLDNNLCERALKKVVLHRKNSLFYKTECGAYVGDMFMSLIHTCKLNNINPFHYLTELQRNTVAVFKNPSDWMPWNYQSILCAQPP